MLKHHPYHQSKHLLHSLLMLISLLFAGCFSTHLENYKAEPELDELIQSAEHQIPLYINDPNSDSSRGFQFLLGIIPTARIFTDDLKDIVTAKLQYHAGSAGYGLIAVPEAPTNKPRIVVNVTYASINGYDLLFTRRPSAAITLEGNIFNHEEIVATCSESGNFSELSKFAFAEDLTRTLATAADQASQKLLICLGVIPSP